MQNSECVQYLRRECYELQNMVGGGLYLQNMVGWGLDLQFILLKNIWNWSAQILRIFGDLTFRFFAD